MQGEHQDVIAKLWDDARPRLLARVDALEAALARPTPPAAQVTALREAHTLIGTLGSFGRMDASNHARAAEAALQQGDDETLALAIAALRTEIEGA